MYLTLCLEIPWEKSVGRSRKMCEVGRYKEVIRAGYERVQQKG